jgi:hypothetical protein
MRKIVLFYFQQSDVPFWKIRTANVSQEYIDTESLPGAAQPRCSPGMLVVVDGALSGVVESVARLGGSNRFRIALRQEIDEGEKDLIGALEKLALVLGEGDGGDAPDVDAPDLGEKTQMLVHTGEADPRPLALESLPPETDEPPAKPKRKPKADKGAK